MDFEYDYGSIGRILDLVREAGGKIDLDFSPNGEPGLSGARSQRLALEHRNALGRAVSLAFTFRDAHADFWSDAKAQRRYDRLGKIAKAAAKLHALLMEDDGEARSALARHLPSFGDEAGAYEITDGIGRLPSTAAGELARLEAAGLHLMAPMNQLPLPHGLNRHDLTTAGDDFMRSLGGTFRDFFHQEPEIFQDDTREPYGPFLAFVMAVREEAGEPVTPDAVRRAWDRARASQDTPVKTENACPVTG